MKSYYTVTTKRPNVKLADIMQDMIDYWKSQPTEMPTYKAYKTREKRATAEIIKVMDICMEEREELTKKERLMFKEFSLSVVNSLRGVIMDKMHPEV